MPAAALSRQQNVACRYLILCDAAARLNLQRLDCQQKHEDDDRRIGKIGLMARAFRIYNRSAAGSRVNALTRRIYLIGSPKATLQEIEKDVAREAAVNE